MAQNFLPAIKDGDKRILVVDGEPVPYCLARIPAQGETRGNLAAGGRGEARPLSESDWKIAPYRRPDAERERADLRRSGRDRRSPDRDQRDQPNLCTRDRGGIPYLDYRHADGRD